MVKKDIEAIGQIEDSPALFSVLYFEFLDELEDDDLITAQDERINFLLAALILQRAFLQKRGVETDIPLKDGGEDVRQYSLRALALLNVMHKRHSMTLQRVIVNSMASLSVILMIQM